VSREQVFFPEPFGPTMPPARPPEGEASVLRRADIPKNLVRPIVSRTTLTGSTVRREPSVVRSRSGPEATGQEEDDDQGTMPRSSAGVGEYLRRVAHELEHDGQPATAPARSPSAEQRDEHELPDWVQTKPRDDVADREAARHRPRSPSPRRVGAVDRLADRGAMYSPATSFVAHARSVCPAGRCEPIGYVEQSAASTTVT